MTEQKPELTEEELDQEVVRELPEREEMSVLRGIQPMPPVYEPLPPDGV